MSETKGQGTRAAFGASPRPKTKSERIRTLMRRAKTEASARFSTSGRDKRSKQAPVTLPGVSFLDREA